MARDGEEALARAETLEPDVALLDIGLPGMLATSSPGLRAQPRYRGPAAGSRDGLRPRGGP